MATISWKRVLAVTEALIIVGAAVGALVGTLIYLGVSLRNGSFPNVTRREELSAAAMFGAAVGAVLGPVLAWTFMRRVSIGRAIGETALGALVGAGISLVVFPPFFLFGTMIGFLGAAVRLFVVSRGKELPRPPGPDPSLRSG